MLEFVRHASDFLDYLAKATPIAIVLAGMLGYYYREKLKSILAKSLAVDIEGLRHQLARDLAQHSATLQRELEAYKVSLIADAERAKATQDVRKAIALKAAERRFGAIADLLDAHLGFDTDVCSLATFSQTQDQAMRQYYLTRKHALHDRLDKYTLASQRVALVVSAEHRQLILQVRQALLNVLNSRDGAENLPLPQDSGKIQELYGRSNALEAELRKLLEQFEAA